MLNHSAYSWPPNDYFLGSHQSIIQQPKGSTPLYQSLNLQYHLLQIYVHAFVLAPIINGKEEENLVCFHSLTHLVYWVHSLHMGIENNNILLQMITILPKIRQWITWTERYARNHMNEGHPIALLSFRNREIWSI